MDRGLSRSPRKIYRTLAPESSFSVMVSLGLRHVAHILSRVL
jgi:hypothetical protein